ncbi:bifunctional phosphoglucose/phosphomannose isomerase [Candidatus Woesearchaeota archaeon]|nr:bifunctional phosphoglucose/phosphomannose isomerase [Candidatus Woesearchaeota archaeon]MCF7901526.1 bifunctional phosphoglucose/phosphomannose isomerase [Candidatus Woesearchaeota archaeon]MCF8013870.1 bifunctional phosphoglucose/phosphomannose isomerase [Candidatus Woesearchaeota archaeon]
MVEEGEIFPDDFFKYDTKKYKRFIDRFSEDIRKAYSQDVRNLVQNIKKKPGMRVVYCGMGGSAIAGLLLQSYIDSSEFHFEVVNDYDIPGKLTSDDLVILNSYSGNTEEMMSCYKTVRREGSQLIIVASGGKLEDSIVAGRIPFLKLPKDYQPRAALPFMFFTVLRLFEEIGLVSPKNEDVKNVLDHLHRQSLDNFAIGLSEKLHGKIPIIYSSKRLFSVAYRWKTQINENAKTVSFANYFPELDHNEVIGFMNKNGLYHVVMLTSDDDSTRMRKRMTISKELLQENDVDVTELHVKGNRLVKIFNLILAGDLTSYYLALRYRTDPEPVNIIEQLKRKMGPYI